MQLTRDVRSDTPQVAGRYRLGNQLAVGGMGVIHVAFDTLLRREVAYKRLKVPHEGARPRFTALFEREYNALRQLKHPNIVEVYDYGLDAEGPYYTMELLTGQDLASAAPLAVADACRIVRDVASALALLHARRLVHRDVTPANVRLTPDGRAKLIDFGALTEFGRPREVVGTPAFIAPECLAGDELDGRADLFSLGSVAYWALTRRLPFPARSIDELAAVWEVAAPAPSVHDASLPRELDELLLALLERERVARPPSAAHVIERLSAVANLDAEQDQTEVAYSYLLHPPLVGRRSILQDLRLFLDEALAGRGRNTMIEGASGLGRSALLDQLATEAQLVGANVLRFQPNGRRDAGLVHGILQSMHALFPSLWSAQSAKHPALARETHATLVRVQSPGEVTAQRGKVVTATLSCLEEMSQRAPLVLLIDDVHRADAESLALIASLARVVAHLPVLLVATQEVGATGSDASALADVRAAATRILLRPLSEDDFQGMVQMVFGDVPNAHRVARFLHMKSGGNPGQCMNLCRLLLQRGEIQYELGRFALPFDPRGDVPGEQALVLTRLSGLSEKACSLVRLASVAENALTTVQAALALETNEEDVLSAAEELSSRDLLRVQEGDLSSASDSLQMAVRASLSPEKRSALHLALSRAILAHGGPSIEAKFAACHHLLCAGQEDAALETVWEPLRETLPPVTIAATYAPVLERLLEALRKRGHPDEHCWSLLSPLVAAGFWGEVGAVKRHQEAALVALSNITGMSLARRLGPRVGKKLALIVGILSGIWRFIRTPKRFRPPTYEEGMQRLFSAVTMATATTASAFEPDGALHVASFLDPIEAMKEGSAGRIAREFAVATAEVAVGLWESCSRRYSKLVEQLDARKVFDEATRANFRSGCLNGRAQADVTAGSPDVLATADELAHSDPFFRPHAESIRMAFHGYRGDKEQADYHRKQGEILALQGGLSWSAFTMFSIRAAYVSMLSHDTMGVLAASVDLERLSAIAPNALWYRDLCLAYVAMARGNVDEALSIYERMAAHPCAHLRPTFEHDAAFHAEALARLGRLQEAKQVCEEAIQLRRGQGATAYSLRIPTQQLALVEAKLGDAARAKVMLEELLRAVTESGGALPIGAVRRDLARVALIENDAQAFDLHFEAMVSAFRDTKHPALIQQCRRLLAEAEKCGVAAAPSWERHQLLAPVNTQDLASYIPDVTEVVDTSR